MNRQVFTGFRILDIEARVIKSK